jgi:transposase-like protein
MARKYTRKNGYVSHYIKPTGKPAGRPSTFTKDIKDYAKTLATNGLTNTAIAKEIGVPESTFRLWLKQYPEFVHDLERSRHTLTIEAQKCLMKRLKGFKIRLKNTATIETTIVDKATEEPLVHTDTVTIEEEIVKGYPPDVTAAKYVLDRRSVHFRVQPKAQEM